MKKSSSKGKSTNSLPRASVMQMPSGTSAGPKAKMNGAIKGASKTKKK
jgi:hypothetical protein